MSPKETKDGEKLAQPSKVASGRLASQREQERIERARKTMETNSAPTSTRHFDSDAPELLTFGGKPGDEGARTAYPELNGEPAIGAAVSGNAARTAGGASETGTGTTGTGTTGR